MNTGIRRSAAAALLGVIVMSGSLFGGGGRDGPVSLDEAIKAAAKTIEETLERGTKVAALNFASDSAAFSEYVLEELSMALVAGKRVAVVDRKDIDLLLGEMNFQMSGLVSDESAQSMGAMLGAQSIVTGSLADTGTAYRLRVNVTGVATAVRQVSLSVDISRNDKQTAFLLKEKSKPAAAPAARASKSKTYKIGDTGPGGGIVFYDKKTASDGWRYLEAAPGDVEWTIVQWGAFGKSVSGTATALGTGKRNTELIVDALRESDEQTAAARMCDALDYGGYDDWFLPSRDELHQMYLNLKEKDLGDFSGERYWSSSQNDAESAWNERFSSGEQFKSVDWYGSKTATYSVRAIRAF